MKTKRWTKVIAIFLASMIMLAIAVPAFADTQTTYTITASAGANGTIAPSGTVVVNAGADQAFTITANSGYHIANVLVDGISQSAISNPYTYTFTGVTGNHTIAASFAVGITYNITASTGANGTITPSGAVGVDVGGSQAFAIAANSGYHIADVLVDGISQGAISSYTFTSVTTNHTIAASFANVTTYTITATAGANGTITPNGAVGVNAGADQAFTITANIGYHVANVVVDGVYQGAISNPYTYTFTGVAANHTISATFANVTTFTITASAGANGTISPSGAVGVDVGGSQAFAIAANSGYHIADVLVDGISQGAISSYTFTGVAANHTIAASFARTPTTVIKSLVIEGPRKARLMEEVTFTVIEKPGKNPVPAADVWKISKADLKKVKGIFKTDEKNNGAIPDDYASLVSSLGTKLGTTDASGKLSATFDTGKYFLVAIKSGYRPGFASLNVSDKLQQLAIKAPKNVTPDQPITITIMGKETHQPVEGVSVWAFSRDRVNEVKKAVSSKTTDAGTTLNSLAFCTPLGKTDAQGKLNATFQSGKYFLVAFKIGYAPVFTPLMVKDTGKGNNNKDKNNEGAKIENGQQGKGNNNDKHGKED